MSSSDRVIDVYDDVMEPHVAELIDNEMKKMQWEYGHWKSDKKKEGYHWTRWAGKTEEEIAAITEPKRTLSFTANGVLLADND